MNHVVLDANVCLDGFLSGRKSGHADDANAFAAYLNSKNVTQQLPIHFDFEVTGVCSALPKLGVLWFDHKALELTALCVGILLEYKT